MLFSVVRRLTEWELQLLYKYLVALSYESFNINIRQLSVLSRPLFICPEHLLLHTFLRYLLYQFNRPEVACNKVHFHLPVTQYFLTRLYADTFRYRCDISKYQVVILFYYLCGIYHVWYAWVWMPYKALNSPIIAMFAQIEHISRSPCVYTL